MVKRKKRAWNNTNPLYRYLHSKKKTVSKRAKVKRKFTGASSMARKKRYSRRASRGGFAVGKRLFPVGGALGLALMGAGIATVQEKFLPQVIPYQSEVAGYAVGGIPGAIGSFARNLLRTTNNASTGGGLNPFNY